MSTDVWICVGTNDGQQDATWFYAFRTYDEAEAFVRLIGQQGVRWMVYPCPLDKPKQATKVCLEILNKHEAGHEMYRHLTTWRKLHDETNNC